jgi:hypothetical protein
MQSGENPQPGYLLREFKKGTGYGVWGTGCEEEMYYL